MQAPRHLSLDGKASPRFCFGYKVKREISPPPLAFFFFLFSKLASVTFAGRTGQGGSNRFRKDCRKVPRLTEGAVGRRKSSKKKPKNDLLEDIRKKKRTPGADLIITDVRQEYRFLENDRKNGPRRVDGVCGCFRGCRGLHDKANCFYKKNGPAKLGPTPETIFQEQYQAIKLSPSIGNPHVEAFYTIYFSIQMG